MTETTESPDQPSIVPDARVRETVVDRRPSKLNQVAAWVAIVAGIVFIVGSVFFTGFFLGRQSGHGGGWQHHRGTQMEFRGGPPMMPMGPGMGPGMAPGMGPRMGPGMGPDRDERPGPVQPPSPPAPPAPRS